MLAIRQMVAIPLILLFLLLAMPALAQGDPVRIDKADNYVVILADGRLDVRYTLTFTELQDGRDRISEMGPFPANHTIVSASGKGPQGAFTVNLTGGPSIYQANFERRTQRGQQYEILVRYTVDRSVFDPTTINGQPYVAIGWAPFQWALPITLQEIRYILPIELSTEITQPEQVTDAVVNATGLLTADICCSLTAGSISPPLTSPRARSTFRSWWPRTTWRPSNRWCRASSCPAKRSAPRARRRSRSGRPRPSPARRPPALWA